MTSELFLIVLGRVASSLLEAKGDPLGGLLNDAITAYRQGKNVDDVLGALAKQWDEQGAPSFDDIAAHRQSIQARMD